MVDVCTTKEKCQCSCCKKRGNRSKFKRLWTIKDLNRVALYVNRDQKMLPIKIVAEVAYLFGYGTLFCQSARAIEKMKSALLIIQSVLTTLAGSKVIAMVVAWLRGLPIIGVGWFKFIAALIILIWQFADKSIKLIESILQDDTISNVLIINKEACAYLRQQYGGEYDDTSNDFDLSDEIKEFLLSDALDFSLDDIFPTGSMKPPTG